MKYTTKSGDQWDSIAHQQMGSVLYTDRLIRANLEYREYYTFPSGIVLTVPEVEHTAGNEKLPPWKCVG